MARMQLAKTKKTILLVLALIAVISSTVVSIAVFTDRVNRTTTIQAATFDDDGYSIERTAPDGYVIAGETLEVTLTESNDKSDNITSQITMTVSWDSPVANVYPWGNSSAGNAVVKLGNTVITYTVNADKTITFTLPETALKAGSVVTSKLTFQIPADLAPTGTLNFNFDQIELGYGGWTADYDDAKLDVLDFSVDVVWNISKNPTNAITGKPNLDVIALLKDADNDGKCELEIIKNGLSGNTNQGVMQDWTAAGQTPWARYNIVDVTFTGSESNGNVVNIGDYAFASEKGITSFDIPTSVTDIGKSAFDGSGLTGTVTIPATVTNIDSLAFGNLPNVNSFTFEHAANDTLKLPSNSTEGTGAFYAGSSYTEAKPLPTTVNTSNTTVLDYAWGKDARGFTVTIVKKTGAEVTAQPVTAVNGQTISITVTVQSGYNYAGSAVTWTSGSKNLAEDERTFTMPVANVTVTPTVNVIPYSITYNTNGGKNPDDAPTGFNVESETVTLPEPTREGYTFDGWYEDEKFKGDVVTEIPAGSTGDRTYYAKWTVIDYSITYETNGGAFSKDPTTTYNIETAVTLPEPTKEGYTFDGWYEDKNFNGDPVTKIPTGSTGDKTFYAKWTAITYTVVYNGNGNTGGSTASSSHTYDMAKALTANGFTKTGYTFAGWNTKAAGTGTSYADKESVRNLTSTNGATVTLYAQWTANTYTVAYNGNGNTGGSTANSSHTYDTAKPLTANGFTKTGYTFAGWATSASGSLVYSDKESVSNLTSTNGGTVTLYAKWTANTYTVTYNGNGNTGGSTANSSHTYGTAKALTANGFTKTGYTFAGWATSASGSVVYSDQESVSNLTSTSGATVTLYAKWTAIDYSISYTLNGGTQGSGAVTSYNIETATFSLPTPTRTGYTFGGWYTSSDLSGSAVTQITKGSTGNKAFYAKWTAITYTVTYNGNGNTGGSTANSSHTYDTAKALTANGFSKTGYTFAGWATSASGSVVYSDQQSVSNLTSTNGATVTLYAKWTANKYTVTYNGNGNTGGSTANSSHTYDTAKALTANGFTKTGYTFAGWATSASGSVVYSDKESVSNLTSTSGGTVTLYAKWTAITYTVTYNGNGNTGGSTANSSHTYDTAKTLTANGFTKTGYTFAGWATSASGSVVYSDKESVSNLTSTNGATVTLYAKWTANTYTVTYNGNGNTGGSTANSSHTYGTAKTLTANGFTKPGYTFAGWATSASGSVVYSDKQSVSNLTSTNGATVTLYAKWTAITYTVTYNGNGNTGGSTANSSHTYDTAKALTANGYTKTGYTFSGWNTKSDGTGTSYANQASVSNLTSTSGGTVTLYAQWTANTYTVTYNGNGNTGGSTANSSHTYGTAKALTANGFTKTGYTFAGWATSASGSVVYSDQQSVSNLTSTNGGTVTLYAQWDPVKPVLEQWTTWYKQGGILGSTISQSSITSVEVVDSYSPTGTPVASWDASDGQVGTVTAYVEDDGTGNGTYKLTIAGNGYGCVYANEYSHSAFSNFSAASNMDFTDLNTSEVVDMQYMLSGNTAVTKFIGLENWDTSNVINFYWTFGGCTQLTDVSNINGWDVSTVFTFSHMFYRCMALTTLDLSGWEIYDGEFTHTNPFYISLIDPTSTSTGVLMDDMFSWCMALEYLGDISQWDMTNVTTTYSMFNRCQKLISLAGKGNTTTNLSSWASQVTHLSNTEQMFQHCYVLGNITGLSNWQTNSLTNCGGMFYNCYALTSMDLSGWDTSNLEYAGNMFYYCSALTDIDISGWQIDSNISAVQMLARTAITELTLGGGWSYIPDSTFAGCQVLTKVYFTHTASQSLTFGTNCFLLWSPYNADNILVTTKSANNTTIQTIVDAYDWIGDYRAKKAAPVLAAQDTWYTQGGTSVAKSSVTSIAFSDSTAPSSYTEKWDASDGQAGTVTAYLTDAGSSTYKLTIVGNGYGCIKANSDSSKAFSGFSGITSFSSISLLDTSNTEKMVSMFSMCSKLTSLNISHFDTRNVTEFTSMFYYCIALSTLDVSTTSVTMDGVTYDSWDTGSAKKMAGMFSSAEALTSLDVSHFDTQNVTTHSQMFYACESLTTLNIATKSVTMNGRTFDSWDTGSSLKMNYMFFLCKALTSLDLSHFDTADVENFSSMFHASAKLATLKLRNGSVTLNGRTFTPWVTDSATDMSSMFSTCNALPNLDVTYFNTSKVTDFSSMFYGCLKFTTLNVSNFNTSAVTDAEGLEQFAHSCSALTSITLGTNFGQSGLLPDPGAITGMFYYVDTITTTVTGANSVMKAYGWSTDHRTVTFK